MARLRIDSPGEPTLLRKWLEDHDVSAFQLAKPLQCDPKTVIALAAGKQLPSYIMAFRIQDVTGIAAESWLGTELGRIRFSQPTFDWGTWLEKKAEATARYDAKRKAGKE